MNDRLRRHPTSATGALVPLALVVLLAASIPTGAHLLGSAGSLAPRASEWGTSSPALAPAVRSSANAPAPLLVGGLTSGALHVPVGTWTNLSAKSSSAPTPRQSFSMEYDPLLNASILFGGQTGSGAALGDTWKLANNVWTQLSPASSPAARWAGGLVYDPVMKSLILFGGRDPNTFYSDTWTYDASGWTQLTTASAPPAEQARFITYDSADGYVFFPAQSITANPPQGYNSYWKFQSGIWTNLTSSLKMNGFPGSTSFNTVTDDPGDGYVLLFGGILGCAVREGLSWAYAG
ncbi:MAG: kelch motif-containing protein, partial [Thermoplasmata archaeon]|nr:kelch motif-containing protein [Thermoplasmata archaeon]